MPPIDGLALSASWVGCERERELRTDEFAIHPSPTPRNAEPENTTGAGWLRYQAFTPAGAPFSEWPTIHLKQGTTFMERNFSVLIAEAVFETRPPGGCLGYHEPKERASVHADQIRCVQGAEASAGW